MNRNVNAISGRLSLRKPQRDSLEILHRITELAPPTKDMDREALLAALRSEFPTVTDFEREFASLCFALATGVGKTRLMGAFIAYLHLEHGINNFFVMAPNLTIYKKLIDDFTPNTRKYVFNGISEFATDPPEIIPADKSNMAKYLFGGFKKCLYPVQKFQSDAERRLAAILERDAIKWFKPAKGQFQMYYKLGAEHPEYQPDFVAETDQTIYMLEPKAKNEMEDPIVLAKKKVAETWCQNASTYAAQHGGKPWKYAIIAHNVIADNMSLEKLAK